jgi:hypothetical protein
VTAPAILIQAYAVPKQTTVKIERCVTQQNILKAVGGGGADTETGTSLRSLTSMMEHRILRHSYTNKTVDNI